MRWLAILYIFAIHLALLWLLLPRLRARPDRAGPQSFADRVEHGARRAAQLPGAVAIVGDSRVEDLAARSVAPDAENFGIGGDTLGGVTARLSRYRLADARAVILEAGINEWPFRAFEGFAERYRAMLAAVPAGVPAIVAALAPVDEAAAGADWAGVNAKLPGIDAAIRAACAAHPGCTYAPQPFGASLKPEYHVGDGLHLSPAGAALMAASWRETLAASVPSAPSTPRGSPASPGAR